MRDLPDFINKGCLGVGPRKVVWQPASCQTMQATTQRGDRGLVGETRRLYEFLIGELRASLGIKPPLEPASPCRCKYSDRCKFYDCLISAPPSTLRARGLGLTSLISALTRSFSSFSADLASASEQPNWATC